MFSAVAEKTSETKLCQAHCAEPSTQNVLDQKHQDLYLLCFLFHHTWLLENTFHLHVFAFIVVFLPFYFFLRCVQLLLKILDYLYDLSLEVNS